MTTQYIELNFDMTPRERSRAREFLYNHSVKNRIGLFRYLVSPQFNLIFSMFYTIITLRYILKLIAQFHRGGLPKEFGILEAIGITFMVIILGESIKTIGNWLCKTLGGSRSQGTGCDGVHRGPLRMIATDEGLIFERAKLRSTFLWPAILRVEEDKHTLFLMMSRDSAIIVPKSTFASKAAERSFRDFVQQRVEATA